MPTVLASPLVEAPLVVNFPNLRDSPLLKRVKQSSQLTEEQYEHFVNAVHENVVRGNLQFQHPWRLVGQTFSINLGTLDIGAMGTWSCLPYPGLAEIPDWIPNKEYGMYYYHWYQTRT